MISKGSLVRVPTYSVRDVVQGEGDDGEQWSEEVFLVISDTWKNDWGQTLVNVWFNASGPTRMVVDNLKVISQ